MEPPSKKRKQLKLTSFVTKQKDTVSTDINANKIDSENKNSEKNISKKDDTANLASLDESSKKTSAFISKWKRYAWLKYDEEKNLMFCKLCSKHGKDNVFVTGTISNKISAVDNE